MRKGIESMERKVGFIGMGSAARLISAVRRAAIEGEG